METLETLSIQKTPTHKVVFFQCGNVAGFMEEDNANTMAHEYEQKGGKVVRLAGLF